MNNTQPKKSYVLSVSQLNQYVKLKIDQDPMLSNIYIRGEISNCKIHSSGHIYLSLKDENSVLRAVMFRSAASKLIFKPENGLKIIAKGRISVFERDGQYQFYIDKMQPEGTGSLYLAYEQLKEKLKSQGYFDADVKKKIPRMPKTVGVITSPTGAAIRDIINILNRRYPLCDVMIYPALVQGVGAPTDLCAAVRYFNETKHVDVIIIGRGGGSIEELWAFNDENLAKEIYASQIPVISAVGHETDFTICDFVADMRAPTPSGAAELCTPDIADIYRYLTNSQANLTASMQKQIAYHKNSLSRLATSGVLMHPHRMFADKLMMVEHFHNRLAASITLELKKKSQRFSSLVAKLDALSPLDVLKRGYSIAMTKDEMIVRKTGDVGIGDEIELLVTDGKIISSVQQIQKKEHPR